MNDWAAAAAVLGLSCVNAGNVYYLELRDTYFLRVRKKQTNEARHDGFTAKSFLRPVVLTSGQRLVAHQEHM